MSSKTPFTKFSRFRIGVGIIILVFFSAWILWRKPMEHGVGGGRKSDVEFEELQLRELVLGQPRYVLSAARASIFMPEARTELFDISVAVPASGGEPAFYVQSQRGQLNLALGVYEFQAVVLNTQGARPLHIESRQLRWQPGDTLLQCVGEVFFHSGGVQGHAARAIANLGTQRVTLFDGVHARIQP